LLNVRIWNSFRLIPAILITCYAFTPAILCTVICTLHLNAFLKAGLCIASSTVMYYFTDYVIDVLLGTNEKNYQVNFYDWEQYLEGNIRLIVLISLLFVSAVFIGIGFYRAYKKQK